MSGNTFCKFVLENQMGSILIQVFQVHYTKFLISPNRIYFLYYSAEFSYHNPEYEFNTLKSFPLRCPFEQ